MTELGAIIAIVWLAISVAGFGDAIAHHNWSAICGWATAAAAVFIILTMLVNRG